MSDWVLGKKLNQRIANMSLDHLIYQNMMYTVLNDLKTYGDASCFLESMGIIDRSEFYKMPSFVNSKTPMETIVMQAIKDNMQMDLADSLLSSNLKKFISNKYEAVNSGGLLGRLLNLCAKVDGIDLNVSTDEYNANDILNDNNILNILTDTLFEDYTTKLLFQKILAQNYSKALSALKSNGNIVSTKSNDVSGMSSTSITYNGNGILFSLQFDVKNSISIDMVTNVVYDNVQSTTPSTNMFIGMAFNEKVTANATCKGYGGSSPIWSITLNVIKKGGKS